MLIKLTKAAGGTKLVNTTSFLEVDEPQARDDGRYPNSRSVVTYDRSHPTKPNTQAFDFFQETPDQIFQLARGEIGSVGRSHAPAIEHDDPGPQAR